MYDLSVSNAEVSLLKSGLYSVEFDINGSRISTDDEGNEITIAIDELIQIALYKDNPIKENSVPIYLEAIQINQPKTRIKIVVKNKPEYVVVDPEFTRLDQTLFDNMIKLGEKQ